MISATLPRMPTPVPKLKLPLARYENTTARPLSTNPASPVTPWSDPVFACSLPLKRPSRGTRRRACRLPRDRESVPERAELGTRTETEDAHQGLARHAIAAVEARPVDERHAVHRHPEPVHLVNDGFGAGGRRALLRDLDANLPDEHLHREVVTGLERRGHEVVQRRRLDRRDRAWRPPGPSTARAYRPTRRGRAAGRRAAFAANTAGSSTAVELRLDRAHPVVHGQRADRADLGIGAVGGRQDGT